MIKLNLMIDGLEIPFDSDGINGRSSIEAFRLMEKLDKAQYRWNDELIEDLILFVGRLFRGQFTRDEFLDGCQGSIFVIGPQLLNAVIRDVSGAISEIPARPTQAAEAESG